MFARIRYYMNIDCDIEIKSIYAYDNTNKRQKMNDPKSIRVIQPNPDHHNDTISAPLPVLNPIEPSHTSSQLKFHSNISLQSIPYIAPTPAPVNLVESISTHPPNYAPLPKITIRILRDPLTHPQVSKLPLHASILNLIHYMNPSKNNNKKRMIKRCSVRKKDAKVLEM